MRKSNHAPVIEGLENRQFLSAGQLDSTFGSGGKVLTDQGLAGGGGIALQADGKIVMSAQGDGFGGFNLIRYNSDGSVDTAFGDDGVVTSLPSVELETMAVQPDGKILLAGRLYEENSSTITMSTVLARYNNDGSFDTSFGDGGVVTLPGDSYANDGKPRGTLSPGNVHIAVQVDGKILLTQVLGDDGTTAGPNLHVIRLDDTGALDGSFGDGGHAVIQLGLAEIPKDIAIQADGKIVVAIDGYTIFNADGGWSSSSGTSYLLRLNSDGTTDTDFGTDGLVTEEASSWQINVNKLAIGLDGKLLLMGEEMDHGRGVESFLISYNSDGTRNTDFGTGGRQDMIAGGGGSFADLLVQPDGKVLLSGVTDGPNGKPAVLSQRINEDGSTDTDYGNGGSIGINVGNQFDYGGAMALQADGSILLAGSATKSHDEHSNDMSDAVLLRLEGDAGSAGSAHASLRRGKDQQAPYLGKNKLKPTRSPKRIAIELAAQAVAATHHRSPKRIAMEIAAKVQEALADGSHRSPKRIALELAAGIFSTTNI